MSFLSLQVNEVGKQVLMTGNEAVARAAIEAGVSYASSYPGSPSSEILGNLGKLAKQHNLYAEWSTNEKVALEGAAAASFAGVRAICIVKPDGLNVAFDTLKSLTSSGTKGGLVLVVSDDPSAHSSTNEEDSRYLEKVAHMPILEPSTPQEAKDMTVAAFDLSEKVKLPVCIRSVTRICHASGNVTIGPVNKSIKQPVMGPEDRFVTNILFHAVQEKKLAMLAQLAEQWPFNRYQGPENARTLIITAGPGFVYAQEALSVLGVEEQVGILKLGISWPLPENFIVNHLEHADQVIFLEEIEPFNEENIMRLAAHRLEEVYPIKFYGQKSGHVSGQLGPGLGEINPDTVIRALAGILNLSYTAQPKGYGQEAASLVQNVPERELAFCAGCPHRASFWAVKSALAINGRNGVVMGDIGCYTMGLLRTGYKLLQAVLAMGSGVGLAHGLGKLDRFGFEQPVVAMVGDSTFYHAAIPALINAKYNKSNFLLVVLDNETTAMTGHQPHPGLGLNAMGDETEHMPIEKVVNGLGLPVEVYDPYDVDGTTKMVFDMLQEQGTKVLVLRRTCALVTAKKETKPKVYVDQKLCIGDECGCNRFCSRTFACPASIWDKKAQKAIIDEAVCNRCGVCVSLCPQNAIKLEGVEAGEY
ncbi:indolepyruvate ferredoxin oxidoreductase subunit alpha [Metallumcola ferriviriculae]|uniref:Indolepyruvate oxidoreductase subunit IorA n=1 Tax=Metallumcola ferriviriculae TaxID=3039180 RepID=A0AAU0ULG2_9FIRM|nr:indolepyruvate ferredoxin oxidoreductase subunit alpha [Desulfitibacteraceae bacterium MK1]